MSKLNKQQKLEIYHDWKLKGLPVTFIASQRKLNAGSLDYMIHLIDRYGIGIYDQPNETFTKEFKEQAIEQALTGQQSITKLSLELGLRSCGILNNWIRAYKETGIMSLSRRKDEFLP